MSGRWLKKRSTFPLHWPLGQGSIGGPPTTSCHSAACLPTQLEVDRVGLILLSYINRPDLSLGLCRAILTGLTTIWGKIDAGGICGQRSAFSQ
jgi:hypothetical protein